MYPSAAVPKLAICLYGRDTGLAILLSAWACCRPVATGAMCCDITVIRCFGLSHGVRGSTNNKVTNFFCNAVSAVRRNPPFLPILALQATGCGCRWCIPPAARSAPKKCDLSHFLGAERVCGWCCRRHIGGRPPPRGPPGGGPPGPPGPRRSSLRSLGWLPLPKVLNL